MATKNPFSDINDLIDEYDMVPEQGTVLCAVSGGADSVYLLCRLQDLQSLRPFHLVAAHYNHRLRGAESDRDEAFVRDLCAKRDIPCLVGGGDVAEEATRRGKGIEETARAMRYAFLQGAAEECGAARIATGHTADDNAETLLLHLIRGSGLQGLAGIPPRRDNLIRPLLTTTRQSIEDYLRLYDIPHMEDSSNRDDAYSRNKVRHQIVPLLEEINPWFTQRMRDTIRYLRADNDFLNAQAAQICQSARWAEDNIVIEARLLAQAPSAVAPRCARRLLEMMGDGDTDCAAAHLNAIVDLCRGDDPSAVCFLPGGVLVQRVYKDLLFTTEADPAPFAAVALHAGENPVAGTGWTVRVSAPTPGLVARSRKVGDEITLPKRGTKSVKKLFIDEKIPRRLRDQIPVVADEDGVLALAGFGWNTAHPAYGTIELTFKKQERRV